MKLTFGTHNKHDTLVTEFTTFKECRDAINKYLEENKYSHSGYDRIVGLSNKETMIDFGSWTEFFYIDASFEEFMALRDKDIELKGDDPRKGRKLDEKQ